MNANKNVGLENVDGAKTVCSKNRRQIHPMELQIQLFTVGFLPTRFRLTILENVTFLLNMNALGKVKIELTLLSERNNVQFFFVLFVIIL